MLPDQLNHLRSQYDQLVADFEANVISFEDAQQALDDLVAIDGTGQHWSIDLNGDFTCAADPTAPQQVTDPSRFTHAQLPSNGPAVPPWAAQQGGAPAGGPSQPGLPDLPPGGPGPVSIPDGVARGQVDPDTGFYQPPADPLVSATPRHLGDADSTRDKLKAKVTSSPVTEKARTLFANHRRLLLILAGIAVLLIVLSVYQRITHDPLDQVGTIPTSEEEPGMADPPPPPASEAPAETPAVETPDADADTDTDTDTDGETAPAEGNLPTVERIQQVISAVTSGDRDAASGVVVDAGSEASVAMNTAVYAGWDSARVAIIPESAVDDDGVVLQTWTIQDADSQTPYTSATVTWVGTDDGWKLATWPNMSS